MRKRIAVLVLVMSMSTLAAPAMASNAQPERQATATTQVAETRPVPDESEARPRLRRFCAANPDHERCQNRDGEVNVRQLIWRLINAGEWRQLFHLLHRLGII
jgi:hypothetical protein